MQTCPSGHHQPSQVGDFEETTPQITRLGCIKPTHALQNASSKRIINFSTKQVVAKHMESLAILSTYISSALEVSI
jgi:hypothetical protein